MNAQSDNGQAAVGDMLLGIVRRQWWLVLLCAIVGAAAAAVVTAKQQKQYQASAELLFRVDTSPDLSLQTVLGLPDAATQIDPTRQAATNVALVNLGTVAEMTAQALGQSRTASQVSSEVTVQEVGQSDLLSITATDPSPTIAATLANTFAREFIVFRANIDRAVINAAIQGVQSQLSGLAPAVRDGSGGRNLTNQLIQLEALARLQSGNAQLVQSAAVPTSPSSPRTKVNVAAGGLLGVIVGIALAFVFYRLDGRAESPEELAEQYDRPVLGVVPQTRELLRRRRRPSKAGSAGARDDVVLPAPAAEAFRAVRARLRYVTGNHDLRSVLVTSAAQGEGKSTVAWQLARVIALAGKGTVLVLETDLRRPAFAQVHGLRTTPGLVDVLSGRVPLDLAIQSVDPRAGDALMNGNGRHGVARSTEHKDEDESAPVIDYVPIKTRPRFDTGSADVSARSDAPLGRFVWPTQRTQRAHWVRGSTPAERGGRAAADTDVAAPRSAGQPGQSPKLDVLVAGSAPTNPADLLESHAMSDLVETVVERYDFVVLDAPPGPVMSDILPLMSYVNGVVIVGSLRHASKRAAAELRSQLELANAPVLGVVANNAKAGRAAYYATKRRANAPANGAGGEDSHAHRV